MVVTTEGDGFGPVFPGSPLPREWTSPTDDVAVAEKLTKNGRVRHLQGLRYTNFEKLKKATSLDEAF
jgi:hypothetical protein